MPTMTVADLGRANFVIGAGGQWYKNNDYGNGDPGDNHTHLMGNLAYPGYDPVANRNPQGVLDVTRIELKIRCANSQVTRYWLLPTADAGDFLMPHAPAGASAADGVIARQLYAELPNVLRAE